MGTTNILVAGVGGQGLVLTTRIIASVAFAEGFDVKTTDVVGLAQRGGMVWGCVRFGTKVHAPLIPRGEGDFLLAVEDLEGLRWAGLLKPGAVVILGQEVIFPNRVLLEKDEYPQEVESTLRSSSLTVKPIEARAIARELGNIRLANTVLLGYLSTQLPFAADTWLQVIQENVPPRTIAGNVQAFGRGRDLLAG